MDFIQCGDFAWLILCPQLPAPEPRSCLQRSTYRDVCMELDEKMLPLETQFANFGPVECVDLCVALQGWTWWLQQDGASEDCRNTKGQELSL